MYALDGPKSSARERRKCRWRSTSSARAGGVYISGLPYSFENSRVCTGRFCGLPTMRENLHRWFSTNYNVEVHAYVKNGKYCIVNNTYEPQTTTVYKGDGTSFELSMEANEIIWKEI